MKRDKKPQQTLLLLSLLGLEVFSTELSLMEMPSLISSVMIWKLLLLRLLKVVT